MFVYGLFFFFQAEDGIRDLTVTGVQTCALPICEHGAEQVALRALKAYLRHCPKTGDDVTAAADAPVAHVHVLLLLRSEERRVGKECRSEWSSVHKKTKTQCTDRR